MISLIAAFQFLTLMPPLISRTFKPRELANALVFYPLVGLVMGALLYFTNYGLSFLVSPGLRAVLVCILWVVIVGGFHLDGFLDSLDGLFGGFTPEQRLDIMRDERVGAYALIGGVLLLLLKYNALLSLSESSLSLVLIPAFSRLGMVFALVLFPYARQEGLGKVMKDHAGWRHLLIAGLISAIPATISYQFIGLGALLVSLFLTWMLSRFIMTKIPGLTGDNYGAINEILEVCLLLFFIGQEQ